MTLRLLLACIFASGIAFSDSLKSALQYGAELESKHSSLGSIKEDTDSIEDALKAKVDKAIKKFDARSGRAERTDLNAHELRSIIPPSSQPGFIIRAVPNGTLSPQSNAAIINRGIVKDSEEGK